MIRFLFGDSASEKSKLLMDMLRADAEAGIPSLLIVPEQEAVQTERLTLEALPPSAQLTLEVLNFSRLYNRVCRDFGGLCYSYATKPIKHLIMWKTLGEVAPLLEEYSSNALSDPAFASTMLSTVSEMKYASVTPDMLESAAEGCSDTSPSLSRRLRDVALIYGAYCHSLGEKYTDSADDLSRLCDILDRHDFFAGKNVYFHSFTSFTAVEHRVIEKTLRTAQNVTVTIPLSHPNYSDIGTVSIENSLKTLKKNAGKWGGHEDIVVEDDDTENPSPLRYAAKQLWNLCLNEDEQRPSAEGRIVMEICDTAYSESEATASHILELLKGGARCRDVVVIMRDAGKYHGIIEPAFERASIPYFVSEKTDLCSLAPVKFILTALRIRQYNWRKNDVISHIKTGLCDFEQRDADIFEEYVNTWNISGSRFTDGAWTMNPDGFSDRLTERGKLILNVANDVRVKLCEPLEKLFVLLDSAQSIADMCRAVYTYTEAVGLRERSVALAERELSWGNKKAASELAGVYDVILKALADIGEALCEVRASVDDFYTVLKTVFDNTDIGTIPTSVDEVTVGSASMLRASNPKYVFVLGLCEGEFPANVEDTGLFSATDRETLDTLDVTLGADGDERSSEELMFVRRAFASASEKLYLFTHSQDSKGSKRTPSLPFRRVQRMFCDLTPHRFVGADLTYLCGSPQSAASHLRSISSPASRAAATMAVAEYIPDVESLSQVEVSTEECRISPDIVKSVIGNKIYVSPSSLEKYVKCPFSYFAAYMLSLRETKYGRMSANHVGNFVHYVMEQVVRFAVPSDKDTPVPTREELDAQIELAVDNYVKAISPDIALKTKRMEHLYARLRRLSALILDSVTAEFADSDFRPVFFELHIDGKDGAPAPMELPLKNGAKIVLKGFIDRVDVWKDGDRVYVRIVDYKTGSKQFALSDLSYGLNTQMLLYLFALCTAPGARFCKETDISDGKSPIPAGVVYLSSAIPKTELNTFEVSEEEILGIARDELSRSGLILDDKKVIEAMSHSLSKDILMGVSQKDGKLVGKSLISSEAFGELYDSVCDTLSQIGESIYAGIADCKPLELAGTDPCKYCTVRQMCRRTDK